MGRRGGAPAEAGTAITADDGGKLLFFASDGLRQDAVEKYSDERVTPGFRELLRKGAYASGHGLLTQAPPNTGAGWFTLATGAWPAVHGSTNNTFHINGGPFANSTSALPHHAAASSRRRRSRSRPSAAASRSPRSSGPAGAAARSTGRRSTTGSFRSGRGVATNYIAPEDSAQFIAAFGLQFDHPDGFARPRPLRRGRAAPPPPAGPACRAPTARPRRCGCACSTARSRSRQVRPQRVPLRQPQRPPDALRPRALQHAPRAAPTRSATSPRASGPTSRSRSTRPRPTRSTARPARSSSRSSGSTGDLSQVRLFHTVGDARHRDAGRPGPARRASPARSRTASPSAGPSSQAGDFAVLEAGIVSEETYIEQGEYWETLYQPLIKYVLDTYQPDLAMVGYPVTDEVQHQFLGLVTRKLPNGDDNPSWDDVNLDGERDHRVRAARALHRGGLRGLRRDHAPRAEAHARPGPQPRSSRSDHGFAPQFLAIDASKVLVDLGLLQQPQPGNCRRPAADGHDPQGEGLLRGRRAADLPERRRPRPGVAGAAGRPAAGVPAACAANRGRRDRGADPAPPSRRSRTRTTGTGDGAARGLEGHRPRRTPRPRPGTSRTAPGGTADMAHPTRTGDLVVFAYPPYQFDAATPGTLIAPSAFFGQHGYVPDVQDLRSNTNMRATFLAGGTRNRPRRGARTCAASTSRRRRRSCSASRRRSTARASCGATSSTTGIDFTPVNIVGLNDFHGQLDPAATTLDAITAVGVGGAAQLATMFDEEAAALPGQSLLLAAGDNVGASPPNSALLRGHPGDRRGERVGARRHELRQPRVRLRDRAHPAPPGAGGLPVPRRPTSSRRRRVASRSGCRPPRCSASTASGSA